MGVELAGCWRVRPLGNGVATVDGPFWQAMGAGLTGQREQSHRHQRLAVLLTAFAAV